MLKRHPTTHGAIQIFINEQPDFERGVNSSSSGLKHKSRFMLYFYQML